MSIPSICYDAAKCASFVEMIFSSTRNYEEDLLTWGTLWRPQKTTVSVAQRLAQSLLLIVYDKIHVRIIILYIPLKYV